MGSFCILKLDQVIIWPLPGFLGERTTSCAYRCGAIDTSRGGSEPVVYITDRNTDLPIIARLAPWMFADPFPMIRPVINDAGDSHQIQIDYLDREHLFYAETQKRHSGQFTSQVFASLLD